MTDLVSSFGRKIGLKSASSAMYDASPLNLSPSILAFFMNLSPGAGINLFMGSKE